MRDGEWKRRQREIAVVHAIGPYGKQGVCRIAHLKVNSGRIGGIGVAVAGGDRQFADGTRRLSLQTEAQSKQDRD